MPYVQLQTNVEVTPEQRAAVTDGLAQTVAQSLGKDPMYMIAVLDCVDALHVGGAGTPAAFVEVRALDLTVDKVAPLAEAVTAWCGQALDISAAQVHLNAFDVPRERWAMAGKPFA